MKYLKGSGKFNNQNLSIAFKLNGEKREWYPGLADDQNLKGTTRTLDGCTGGFQWNGDPVQLEDGLLSRNGWALIDDSNNFLFDNSEWSWVQERKSGDCQDWYFFGHGLNYKEALKDYTSIAGRIPMIPKYAFGYWWSRYWSYSDPELKDLMKQMRSYDIPIDVLIIDMDWHETFGGLKNIHDPKMDETGHKLGWTGYSWNRNLFPNPEKFLDWTESYHLKTALNLHPASGIAPMEDQYEKFANAIDFDTSSKKFIRYQMSDKKWATTYFNEVLQPMEQQGVDFWWLDWQQEPTSNYVEGLSNTWWLNYTFFTDMERRGNKRPLLFHRWGGMGNHRYQIGFSGDDKIDWGSLKYQTYFTHTASNVGYSYWSHDIGGHAASDYSSDPQLFLRWLQFGVFSPILRTHSAKMSSVERRFWMYPDLFPEMRELIQFRYQLAPYIYNASRQSYDEGIGILRPMYYEHPTNEEAYQNKYQYYFGDHMIVAPIADSVSEENQLAKQEFWLPEGKWFEWYSGSLLQGNQTHRRDYAMHEIPLFIRAGAIIPMYPNIEHLQQEIDTLVLSVMPEGADVLRYYEDDGKSIGYQKDEYAYTTIESSRNLNTSSINIAPTEGSYKGMLPSRAYQVRLPNSFLPESVLVNGSQYQFSEMAKTGSWNYDANNLELVISVPSMSRNQSVVIEVVHQQGDQKLLAGKKGKFKRLTNAVSKMKMEVVRGSWWATLPNSVFAAEQTPLMISYDLSRFTELLESFDENYESMLQELANHENARKEIAEMWVKYLK